MSVLPSPVTHSRMWQAWAVASDLIIATALMWMLPLLLGVMGALFRLLVER